MVAKFGRETRQKLTTIFGGEILTTSNGIHPFGA